MKRKIEDVLSVYWNESPEPQKLPETHILSARVIWMGRRKAGSKYCWESGEA